MTGFILSVGYIAFCLLLISKLKFFRHESISPKNFQLFFLVKLLAGLALFIIYTRYYPERKYADIFRYYDDSKIMFDALQNKPYDFFRMFTGFHSGDKDLRVYYDAMLNWYNSEMIFNDSRTMIRLNALMRFFSMQTYFPHVVFMCFLSFCGLTALFKVFTDEVKNKTYEILFGVFMLPSVLLWSSGVIKEALLLFSIGMLIYYQHKMVKEWRFPLRDMIIFLFFIFCLLNIKSYILFAILPGLIAYGWTQRYSTLPLLKFLIVHTFYFLTLFNLSSLFTHHPVPELLHNKQKEFYVVASREKANSVIRLPKIHSVWKSLLKAAPAAFVTTLLRPHLFEANNIMLLMAALENGLIILLIVIAFFGTDRQQLRKAPPIFFLALFFTIIMFTLIGLVTPILGAIVRYKVPALPFLFLLLAVIYNREKLIKRLHLNLH